MPARAQAGAGSAAKARRRTVTWAPPASVPAGASRLVIFARAMYPPGGSMAVVTVALRQRTSIAVLRVKDDVIVLQTMMWPDEVRTPDFSVEAGEVKDAEVKMAQMLIETLSGDFDASEFEDDYAEAVQAVVKAKIEGGEVKRTETSTKTGGEVVDLLAALQRSVEAAKTSRGEESAEKPAKKSAAKKSASKSSRKPGRTSNSTSGSAAAHQAFSSFSE